MKRFVVDTNLLAIANGRQQETSKKCKLAVIDQLARILKVGRIVVDDAGEIVEEYKSYCNFSGQPNVGDAFFREVMLNYSGNRVLRVSLSKNLDGQYTSFPADVRLQDFDPSDRKFVAAGIVSNARVYSATDKDWLDHLTVLNENDVKVKLVCSADVTAWFERPS